MAVAGGKYNNANNQYYLCAGVYYWTMSSYYFYSTEVTTLIFNVNWAGGFYDNNGSTSLGLRPVINLKSNVTITEGDGTVAHPFVIE